MNENVDFEEEIESVMGTRDGWFTLGSMSTYLFTSDVRIAGPLFLRLMPDLVQKNLTPDRYIEIPERPHRECSPDVSGHGRISHTTGRLPPTA